MLNILLVGNYSPDQQKSMAAFLAMMQTSLIDIGHHVEVIHPERCLLPKNLKPHGLWKWIAYIDKFIIFPFKLKYKSKKFDIVHICDHSNAMYVLVLSKKPVVVTCHDVLAIEAARNMIPDWNVGLMGRLFQHLIFKGLNKSNAIVCVSEYTKSHLKNLGSTTKNIFVALNSLNADFFPDNNSLIENIIVQAGLPINSKYFIHVGSDLPRKNRLFILKIFNKIACNFPEKNLKLLFVGPTFPTAMENFINDHNLTDSVLLVKNASHATLRALYSGSIGLIFPSLQEGFGWPIIEAQACGCPVYTSNILPMTEVGGHGAIYIDTLDEYAAAEKISNSLHELTLMRERGFDNIVRFSKDIMMNNYLSAYSKVTKELKP
jgi:glycosyltransferase involved in cell wall biosynthesis